MSWFELLLIMYSFLIEEGYDAEEARVAVWQFYLDNTGEKK